MIMFSVILRSVFAAAAILGLSLPLKAQDYRGIRQNPREMVYQEPSRQPNFFERLFGIQQRERYAPAPQPHFYQDGQMTRQNAYINPDKNNYTNRSSVPKASVKGVKSYCVRSCDGFFFPLAGIKGEAKDSLTENEACSTLCPGTPTELYRMTSGSIETMVGPNRKSYSAHPKAFAFREKIEQSCSCKGISTGGLARLPMERDYTLREGDILLLETGAHIFNGGEDYPYKKSDFIMANRGGRLSNETRALLMAKNISLGQPSTSQLASKPPISLADGTLSIDLNKNTYNTLRVIEILGEQKQRPKLLIDIIESRRFNKL